MDPSLKKEVTVYVKTGGKRGRPKMDPTLKKSTVYVKTGGKRGRPRKDS
jgi:geranylgeranyl pyrophosphate synthase